MPGIRALGPGIIYAASAVGVSHLVQATRAGAEYGLALIPAMVVFALLKYPEIRFGGEYAALAGEPIVDRYAHAGRPVLWAVGVLIVLQMTLTFPAVLALTAGLAANVFGLRLPLSVVAAAIVLPVCLLVAVGRYRIVERVTVWLVIVLAVLVIAATALTVPAVPWDTAGLTPEPLDRRTLFFCLALAGFMPTPVDGGLLTSFWVDAKRRAGAAVSGPDARRDFDVGYFGALGLGVCFSLLGAAVMFGRDAGFAASAPRFAGQVLALFTATVGEALFPLIAAAALAVMFSTVLALADGLPRVLSRTLGLGLQDGAHAALPRLVALQGLASVAVIHCFASAFTTFVDVVTFVSFLVSPMLAWLNHRAMFGPGAPAGGPGGFIAGWSRFGASALTATAALYLAARLAD